MASRRLIVNADDFGFTAGVNEGIVEAHRRGILTAASLMANGPAFDHAVELARRFPAFDIGCHLVLVQGKAVSSPGTDLPRTVRHLLWGLLDTSSTKWIERELEAQIEKILQAGIVPSHLDTHKHTHLAPPVLQALCRVSRQFSIPWVRRPFDLPLNASVPLPARLLHGALRVLRSRFDRTLERYNCRTTDHFAGFQWTGAFRAAQLASLVRALPPGLTEFVCHPGYCTAELRHAPTRLKESRAEELEALISGEVKQALEESGVELTTYRETEGSAKTAPAG